MSESQIQTAERWLPVVGYEGLYEVSSLGRLRSLDRSEIYSDKRLFVVRRKRAGRIISQQANHNGYLAAFLCCEGEQKRVLVSGLVARAFIGARPDGYQVCHCDGNKTNNAASNLRYDTASGNMADCIAHGTATRGERSGTSKLTETDVVNIRRLRGLMTGKDIAALYGVRPSNITAIHLRQTWRHV